MILELEWVLLAFYGFAAEDFVRVVNHLLGMPNVSVEEWSRIADALAIDPALVFVKERRRQKDRQHGGQYAAEVYVQNSVAAPLVVNLVSTDTNVVTGTTYYYTLTAVLNGVNSGMSNEASATIPLAAPTGVTTRVQ